MAGPVANMGIDAPIADFSDDESNDIITNQNEGSDNEIEGSTGGTSSLLRKMRAATKKNVLSDSESEEVEDESLKGLSFREKIKIRLEKQEGLKTKTLQGKVREPGLSIADPAPMTNPDDIFTSDEDEDVPVARKRRPARASAPSSPAKPSAEQEESLFLLDGEGPAITVSDDVATLPQVGNARFQELLAKRRQERLAKEEAERAEKGVKMRAFKEALDAEDSDKEDSQVEKLLTSSPQKKYRKKKADEELEKRETQRMARSMQLAHEVVQKKKVSKNALFAKFNYKPDSFKEEEPAPSSSPKKSDATDSTTAPTSPLSPGAADNQLAEKTTKTIEILDDGPPGSGEEDDLPTMEQISYSPPTNGSKIDKRKGPAPPSSPLKQLSQPRRKSIRVVAPKVNARSTFLPPDDSDDDLEIVKHKPITSKKDLKDIFDRVPAKKSQEAGGMHALRMLAHLTSPSKEKTTARKKDTRPSMTSAELAMTLQQRARQQAAAEREEHIKILRNKGVHIMTAEEREEKLNRKMREHDYILKAREEADQIRTDEREVARQARSAAGARGEEVDPLDDSSEDDEWPEERRTQIPEDEDDDKWDQAVDDGVLELSGSEDDEDMAEDGQVKGTFIYGATEESENEEDDELDANELNDLVKGAQERDDDEETVPTATAASRRRSRKSQIVDSEDEEDSPVIATGTPRPLPHDTPGSRSVKFIGKSPLPPDSVLRSATKTFIPGVSVTGPVGLGLTQIFQGTMDSQPDYDASPMPSPSQQKQTQSQSQWLNSQPRPSVPGFDPTSADDDDEIDMVVPSSQIEIDTIPATQSETQAVQLNYEQSQILSSSDIFDSQSQSQMPMTQDAGYNLISPIKGRYSATPQEAGVSQATIDTVVLEPTPSIIPDSVIYSQSAVRVRKGKLRRRAQVAVVSDGNESASDIDEKKAQEDAFTAMRRAAAREKRKKEQEKFDKKKSKAADMVEEDAMESEDEYAGVGGASSDDSDDAGEDEQFKKDMIDERGLTRGQEAELARTAARMDREEDEARVNKLYKDVMTGGLMKKRGGLEMNLSDSDDDMEARRRMKRREFARMRKALMEDENVQGVVEDPKKAAFLKSLEDREEDDMDMYFMDDTILDAEHAMSSQVPAEGSQDTQNKDDFVVPNSQPDTTSTLMRPPTSKRKSLGEPAARAPPALRRTAVPTEKRATSRAEIRASVSQLLENPHSMILDSDSDTDLDLSEEDEPVHQGLLSDDQELENEMKNQQDTSIILGEKSITKGKKTKSKENVDPWASRRTGPVVVDRSLSRQSSATDGSIAFAPSSSTGGFKVPPLLRRATGSILGSAASSFTSDVESGMNSASAAMRDGPKKAAKGFKGFTREDERKMVVEEKESKRLDRMLRGAEVRKRDTAAVLGGADSWK